MTEAEGLEPRALVVLSALRSLEEPRRPFFIEFAGTPKSGKSSCIDTVTHFFRRCGFKVHAPSEGASRRTPYYLKDDRPSFNTWSACYALTQLLEALHHSDRFEIAILDRGIFDSLVWFHMMKEEGEIDEDFCETLHQFMLLPKWRELMDLVLLFQVEPSQSLQRETQHKLIDKDGRAMNQATLGKLNAAYQSVAVQFGEKFTQFHEIDTTQPAGPKQREAAAQVVEVCLANLEEELGISAEHPAG